jgi:pantoate--beta-alanine ligase
MGEKDYQQFYLVKKFIEKKYNVKVNLCKTIRNSKMAALSSRNILLEKSDLNTVGLISNKMLNLKKTIYKDRSKSKRLTYISKKMMIKKFKIKIEYLECRNTVNLTTNILSKPFKIFIAYYLNNIRLIDNF